MKFSGWILKVSDYIQSMTNILSETDAYSY